MWVYLICFAVSCIFLKISEVSKKKLLYNIFTTIGLLIPCILAGLRADTIGTDIQVYVKPMFEAASMASSFLEYNNMGWIASWTYMYVYEIEIGFSLLVYIITKVFGNLSVLLTCIELLIIVPFYKGLSYHKKELPMWLCMLIFYLMNYNVSLNMMRQWIAMALLFYGFRYVLERKLIKFIIVVLISMMFHNSAMLGILFYLIYAFIYSNKKDKNVKILIGRKRYNFPEKLTKVIEIFIVFCFGLLSINVLIILLNKIGLNKYAAYINGDLHLLPFQLLLRLPFIIIILLNWKKYSERYNMSSYLLAMMLIDLLVSQIGSISQYSWRITTYFSMFNCLSYCSICFFSKKRMTRINYKFWMIIYLIVYWVYYFVLQGIHETVPYIFA
ncbi:EpsG family protein [Clostridium tertium]|uniref:EpsG family protein n=1 Tax=Clostridium tertium TaxID=1559 RepID=UPI003DA643A3